MKKVYFDNAATTPITKEVIAEMTHFMVEAYGNPSSSHQFGRTAKSLVENARKNIANYFKVSAGELIFTSGGTEADNLILRNAVVNLGVQTIVTSKIEHHGVLNTILQLEKEFQVDVKYVDLDDHGEVVYSHLRELLATSSNTKTLVSLMFVNNELGNLLDLKKVSTICKEYDALFHSDTVQGIGHYPIDLNEISIDFIVASAHKFHGPKGVGFAYFKKGVGVQPMIYGGEQEKGARSGTENVHSILGMEKAMEVAYENLDEDLAYIKGLKSYFISQLKQHIKGVEFNGNSEDLEKSSYTILSVRFPVENGMLLFSLDLKGIAVSGGSACQSGSHKGSHVLNAILPKEEETKTSIRFSLSKYNTKEEIDYVVGVLKELI